MVPSIARQSVITKCTIQKSILVGNYEFYYLSGLLKKLFQLDISETMPPAQLYDFILKHLDELHPNDEKESYLLKMVSIYRPLEEYDEQMKLLFCWGANEPDLWQMKTSRTEDSFL